MPHNDLRPLQPMAHSMREMLRAIAPMLALARTSLEGGREVAAAAVEQYLAYLGQLDVFVAGLLETTCAGQSPPGAAGSSPS